jgi:hypothetical protein
MKKIFLFFCLLYVVTSYSQDIIVKKDGSIIKAKITDVEEENIKYKKFENPDGPSYTVAKANIISITYANGEVEKFASSEPKKEEEKKEEEKKEENSSENPLLNDENMKKTIEGIAKDVGEQLMRNCANGKVDNSTTEIYWDAVYRDAISKEITISIRTSWKPKFTDGQGKWVKGKILVSEGGAKKWVYQNDNGLMFSGCAKGFKIK